MERRKYPISADAYELLEEVGQGVSAAVHRALCMPFNEIVAIKIIDFERENSDLRNISREAQTMLLIDHPNVLNAHCSFLNDHNLWVVMPFMAGGSCLHILKAAYPSGFEEAVIATILREVLKGLEYLHHQGYIHRDVKAGNILIGSRGTIKLGDFGVSACLFDSGDRQRTRNTFVGTPCWMAPEVMEQLHGYDFKADIWSFGITALELAHGHAPFSKYPPMKVLLMTLQNAPPGLDYERDKKFSKSFKQMIAMCLVKDPSKRPSAQKLLKHSFFKRARSSDYIARTVLEGLPTLGDRLKALKIKEADMVAQKKIPYGKKEEISQNEYKRGISGWNFNIEDVKAQASLIQDDEIIPDKDQVGFSSSLVGFDSLQEKQSHYLPSTEDDCAMQTKPTSLPSLDQSVNILKAKCEGSEDEMSVASSTCDHNSLLNGSQPHTSDVKNDLSEKIDLNIVEKHMNGMTTRYRHKREISNGSDASDLVLSSFETKSDKQYCQPQSMGNCNGGVVSQTLEDTISETLSKASKLAASNTDDLDEKSKKPVVQQKGRFKVTSENVELEKVSPSPMLQKSQSMQVSPSPMLQKSQSMQVISQLPAICLPSPSEARSNLFGCSLFPQLHDILQTNILQRGDILKLMKQLSTGDMSANHIADGGSMPTSTNITEKSSLEAAHDREKELLQDITDLQWRLESAQEELQKLKMKNAQV